MTGRQNKLLGFFAFNLRLKFTWQNCIYLINITGNCVYLLKNFTTY